jgi:hypothetical protein
VVYNPIDTERFNTKNTKDDGYVLFVGTIRLFKRKYNQRILVGYTKSIGTGIVVSW